MKWVDTDNVIFAINIHSTFIHQRGINNSSSGGAGSSGGAPPYKALEIKVAEHRDCYSVLRCDCYPRGCAAPGEVRCQCNTRRPLSKLKRNPPQRKINVTSKSPVGDISVVTLIRTDTTLDHSQKAEKV